MKHTCHAIGCSKTVPRHFLMCSKHWKLVPSITRNQVWGAYRSGQEDGRPSKDYLYAARLAINIVYTAENNLTTQDGFKAVNKILGDVEPIPQKGEKQMRVAEVKYTRRVNTGNYEHEEYSATAVLNEDDELTANEALAKLKSEIQEAISGNSPSDDAGTDEEENEEEANTGKTSKGSKKPRTTAHGKGPKDTDETEEEAEETEDAGEDSTDETEEEETSEEETEEEEIKPAKKPAKPKTGEKSPGKKGFKKKPQVYQRENTAHKDIFSGILRKVAPNWKKSFESKAHAKKVSAKMAGKEFLDEEGNVVPAFETEVKKQMSKFK